MPSEQVKNFREKAALVLNSAATEKQVKALIEEIADMERSYPVYFKCRKCKEPNTVAHRFPDLLGRAKALQILSAEGLGKPTETKKLEVDVRAQTAEEMRELSDDQLLAIASVSSAG